MEDLIGTLLDHFQILELLGRGGMGAVYKARDLRLQRDVAVKVMHPHIAEQGDFKERFLQEARSAARLDHPGIVNVYHFGQVRSLLYIVMQFIPGANLREMLEALKTKETWLPLDEATQLVRQISLALDYAHRRGVLHRDIKPKNIMIEPEPGNGLPYRPIITDLGLAKLADSDFVTRPGSSMGTPAYMSPEQALGKSTDARSDVYSLGVLLYELAVGRVPFPAKTITEAIRYHTEETPPAPRTLRSDLPVALEDVILRTLEKEPSRRFADAAALAQALVDVDAEVTKVGRSATVLGSAVSLMTQYQDSLITPRGPSLLAEFDTPVDVEADSIQLMVDGQTIATVALAQGVTKIGRKEDNDLVLDDPKASRHHVQVAFDGVDYRVVDLGSSNGTYLANAKLLPGVAEQWTPDKPLRIGDTVLRLLLPQRPDGAISVRPTRSAAQSRDVRTSVGKGWVGVLMETSEISVEPGATAVATFVVLNQGPLVDHFRISVEGVPPEWVAVAPPSVHLLPAQQQPATITLRPPRVPASRAGQHPLSIRVTSQSDPSQTVVAEATLSVAAYYQFEPSLRPGKRSGIAEGEFALTVRNQCNADLTLRPEAVDIEDACRYAFLPPGLIVEAGQQRESALKVRPRVPLRGDTARPYNFTVTVRVDEAPGLYEQVRGSFVHVPPAYDLVLSPASSEGRDRGEFMVQVVNIGQADLTLDLQAADAEDKCRLDLALSQVSVPAGQERKVRLVVYPRRSVASSQTQGYPFTVTAAPAAVPGYGQQVHGEWRQMPQSSAVTPSPSGIVQPVVPTTAAAPPATKRRWFWGCVVLILGLLFTAALFFIAANFVGEGLRLGESAAWAGGILAAIAGLVATIRAARRAWRGAAIDGEGGAAPITMPRPIPDSSGPRRFWGLVVLILGLAVTFGLGLGAGNVAFEALGWDDAGAWFAAGFVWLMGFLISLRLARNVWKPKS